MAQTELILRLVKGNKIIGYLKYHNGEMAFSPQEEFPNETQWVPLFVLPIEVCPPMSDSLELGIKVGDEWWFEGDIIHRKGINQANQPVDEKYELVFDGFEFRLKNGTDLHFAVHNQSIKRIDNIHEVER